jgi:hypothetical protein
LGFLSDLNLKLAARKFLLGVAKQGEEGSEIRVGCKREEKAEKGFHRTSKTTVETGKRT